MSNKRKAKRMNNGNQPHDHVQPGHGVDLQLIIDVQREQIEILTDQATVHLARQRQADQQIQTLASMLSQVQASELILRKRLGLGDTEPVELTDDEVAEIRDTAQVTETE